ncbi:MAG TPA: hypothetical protein VLH08_19490 [Acidobacteriota bacterium]|nr:hypothetical protein [Acidobacteriota bacterium]
MSHLVQYLPGIESVAGVELPLTGYGSTIFSIEGRPVSPENQLPWAGFQWITPNFFRTMKIPIIKGREFSDRDDDTAPKVCYKRKIGQTTLAECPPTKPMVAKDVIGINGFITEILTALSVQIKLNVDSNFINWLKPVVKLAVRVSGSAAAGAVRWNRLLANQFQAFDFAMS